MYRKHLSQIAVLFFIVILVVFSAWAETGTINYQGILTDPNGVALQGDYYMEFSLFDIGTGGSPLWDEEQIVRVTNGIYNVRLGSVNPLSSQIFYGNTLYLEVTFFNPMTGWETLYPRYPFTSIAFTIHDQYQTSKQFTAFLNADWQSFTAGMEGILTRIEVLSVDAWSWGNTTLRIYEGEGTSGAFLYEEQYNIGITSSDGIVAFDIPVESAPMLFSGSQYTFQIENIDGLVWLESNDPYAGGRSSFGVDRDFWFRTYMHSGKNSRCLVLLIQYNGQTGGKTGTEFDNMLFSSGTYPTGSMNDYYREVSYEQFGVTGTTYPTTNPWYDASQNESYYTNGYFGMRDTYPKNSQGLVREAVIAADSTVNFADYDTDTDGYVDAIFVIFPGYGGESTGNSGDIWAHKWALSGGNNGPGAYLTNDGVRVDVYTIQPELRGISGNTINAIGVFCHEYGHVLGLPDLYDTTPASWVSTYGNSNGLGNYCLMAGGGWGANGSSPERPAHMCAWAKDYLGWVTVYNVTPDLYGQWIPQIETNNAVFRLWTGGAVTDEYFLVENRQQVGNDTLFPNCGFLIYHIDESVRTGDFDSDGINNWNDNDLQWDETHKFIDLECADQTGGDHTSNTDHLDAEINRGDAGDFFNSTNNNTFNGSSTPGSDSYSGGNTNVRVQNIGPCNAFMPADLLVGPPPGANIDIWIKDCAADNGTTPSTPNCPQYWTSTDIWIDNDMDNMQDAPVVSSNNNLFARIHNNGTDIAQNITVDFYYRNSTTGLLFPDGANFIGQAVVPMLVGGATAQKWVTWNVPPPPANGHYCIGVVVSNAADSPASGSIPAENNVGGINIFILYSRAGTLPKTLLNMLQEFYPETIVATFTVRNPGFEPSRFVLDWQREGAEWEMRLFDGSNPINLPYWFNLEPEEERPITLYITPAVDAKHGDEAFVSMRQYYEIYYPEDEGIVGGIDFPILVDYYPTEPVNDLKATLIMELPPSDLPPHGFSVRLDLTPVSNDIAGNPENIACYNVYRDTSPDFIPDPNKNRIARVAVDANPDPEQWEWFDTDFNLIPGIEEEYYYIVRVEDEAGYESENSNVSDIDQPTITVTSPNGGEIWYLEDERTINWTSQGVIGNVRIEISTDSGSTWSDIISSTPNEGSYTWMVTGPISQTCRIRITSLIFHFVQGMSIDDFIIAEIEPPIPEIIEPGDGAVVSCYEVRLAERQINGNTAAENVWQIIDPYGEVVFEDISTDATNDFEVFWNSHSVPNGQYTVKVAMYDAVGNFGIDEVSIFVKNAPPCEGDFDGDGDVNGSDLVIFATDFGRTDCLQIGDCEGDFDGDGDVDGSDLVVFATDFGRTDCP